MTRLTNAKTVCHARQEGRKGEARELVVVVVVSNAIVSGPLLSWRSVSGDDKRPQLMSTSSASDGPSNVPALRSVLVTDATGKLCFKESVPIVPFVAEAKPRISRRSKFKF